MTDPITLARYGWAAACLILGLVFLFGVGAIISPILLAASALMAWTTIFEDQKAKGRRALGTGGRIAVGALTAVLAILLVPGTAPPAAKQPDLAVSEQATPAVPPAITKSEARELCEGPIRARLSHPSTADFSVFDTALQQWDDGSAEYSIGLTAKNSFGLELELIAYCDVSEGRVTSVRIEEKGS
jgi:hypothetical protein